jgi:hypothetical protein
MRFLASPQRPVPSLIPVQQSPTVGPGRGPFCGRLLTSLVFASCLSAQPVLLLTDEPGAWPGMFDAVGLSLRQASDLPPAVARERIQAGAVGILEGSSAVAEGFGIKPTSKKVVVRSVTDARSPKLGIVWEKAQELPVYELPADARVFAKERWSGAPLMAGLKRGAGSVLWLATKPGVRGYERFPYVLQAVSDLGLQPSLRSNRLWAFFDSSYRSRVDLGYFAEAWRKAGIAALHVAAWHYNEPDAERDAYLRRLIEACHKRAILVYAWVELPHVSEAFWQQHPEWREKTALLQDAHLDWRKLMNLQNPDCFRAVSTATQALIERFDWDGVNIGELYFESLEGVANPSRFTPMNDDIRSEYKALTGVDPHTLFQGKSDSPEMKLFLNWRAGVVKRMQSQWIAEVEKARKTRPNLDIVLTHVDDRFDTRMRDLVGADAAGVLPMLGAHDFQFLIEDPATVWHLGPERYAEIARRYAQLTPKREKLAIDINIVERYQDVYPTKQQTGVELLQLVQIASKAFDRVALYFENSIAKVDWGLLPSAGAVAKRFERSGEKVIVESDHGVGVVWPGDAKVNGRPWPLTDGRIVWLPKGSYVIEPATSSAARVRDFNGDLRTAAATSRGVELSYQSGSRALAVLNGKVKRLEIDGREEAPIMLADQVLALPRGQHLVSIEME